MSKILQGRVVSVNGAAVQEKMKCDFSIDELVEAAQRGDLPYLENAVELHKILPTVTDLKGCSLLHWACLNAHINIAKFLLSRENFDINYAGGENDETALQWAVRNENNTELVSIMLHHQISIDTTHKSNENSGSLDALFIAVQAGHFHIVYLLLVHGANPDTRSRTGDTPLLWLLKQQASSSSCLSASACGRASCCAPDSKDMIRLLLSFKADANCTDQFGNNPLHIISSRKGNESSNLKMLFLLQQHGADCRARNKEGKVPMTVALKNSNKMMGLFFLSDIYMYEKLYYFTPTIVVVCLIQVMALAIEFTPAWYYFVFGVLPACIAVGMFLLQISIPLKISRAVSGFTWGITLSMLLNHWLNVQSFVSAASSFVIYASGGVTFFVIYLCMVSNPAGVGTPRHDAQSRIELAGKVRRHRQSFLGADGVLDVEEIQVCPTCLVDKALYSTHCSQCDRCMVALDHHCTFINNCVGKGNRRLFCIFLATAVVFGTLIARSCFEVEYSQYCPLSPSSSTSSATTATGAGDSTEELDTFSRFMQVQACTKEQSSLLFNMALFAGLVTFWGFTLLYNQLVLVMRETTTFEILYKGRGANGVRPYTLRGLRNLFTFLATGNYLVTQYLDDESWGATSDSVDAVGATPARSTISDSDEISPLIQKV